MGQGRTLTTLGLELPCRVSTLAQVLFYNAAGQEGGGDTIPGDWLLGHLFGNTKFGGLV